MERERFVDSHCHLTFASFRDDLAEVLRRAAEAGVEDIVTLGTDLTSSREAVALAERVAGERGQGEARPRVHAAVGIHPQDASTWSGEALGEIGELAAGARVVALGETGLDYYRDHAPREAQRRAFAQTLALAAERRLPVAVHIRQAHADALGMLAEFQGRVTGVLHCFSGTVAEAERGAELGFYLSFGGPLTYRHPPAETVRAVPRDRLLLETDAPYLTPAPHRGKRNEPSYLPFTARAMASLLDLAPAEVSGLTTENARRLFRLGADSGRA